MGIMPWLLFEGFIKLFEGKQSWLPLSQHFGSGVPCAGLLVNDCLECRAGRSRRLVPGLNPDRCLGPVYRQPSLAHSAQQPRDFASKVRLLGVTQQAGLFFLFILKLLAPLLGRGTRSRI